MTSDLVNVALEQVATVGLRGAIDLALLGDLDPQQQHELAVSCQARQLVPQLASLAIEAQGWSAESTALTRDQLTIDLRRAVLLERELVEVCGLLTDAAIEFRVLKGAAVAHLDYPDPALRLSVDTDLLIRGRDIPATRSLLLDHGYKRLGTERRSGFDDRFEKSITFRSQRGFEVDLHRCLISGPFGFTFDPDRLFDNHETLEIADMVLPALGREERFLHACMTVSIIDITRIRPAADIVHMLENPDLDSARVIELANRWKLAPLVADAVTKAAGRLMPSLSHPLRSWADGFAPTREDERRLACYARPKRASYLRRIGGTVRELPSARLKAAFLYAMILPDSSSEGPGIPTRAKRAARTATRFTREPR